MITSFALAGQATAPSGLLTQINPAGAPGRQGEQGLPGVKGDPGTNGRDGVDGAGTIGTRTAAQSIPAYTFIVDNGDGTCSIADPNNAAHRGKVLGLGINAASAGTAITFQEIGAVSPVTGIFSALAPTLYIGDGTTARLGSIVNVRPSLTTAAWIQSVGTATSSTSINITLAEPQGIRHDLPSPPSGSTIITRQTLGAAASGANTDITSLSGLTTALSIGQGGTGASTSAAARAALGLEKFTSVGDASYTVLSTDKTIALTAVLTAPRTIALAPASSFNPGFSLRIVDQAGGVSSTNTLTVTAAGSDALNGASSNVFKAPYTDFLITTDGISKWTYDVQGVARGGTGATTPAGARTNLSAAASGANSDITSLAGLTTPLSVAQGGTGATTAAAFIGAYLASLPTTLPATSGQLWLNNGVVQVS